MNRRFCVWAGSILASVCFAGFTAGQAVSPAAPAAGASSTATIPLAAYGAADEAPYKSAIETFIKDQLTALTGTDAVVASGAREKLKGALPRGSSASYYSTFGKAWSAGCSSAIAKSVPLSVRLNIAIVTRQLADVGQTLEIQSLVIELLNDREPAVAWWGIKAANPLIIVLIQNPPVGNVPAVIASKVPDAIVGAVKKCGKSELSGFATVDAYAALRVTTIPGKSDLQIKPLLPPLVKPILDVLEFRISQHFAGLVQMPGAERDISTWLSKVYPDASSTEQMRTVQLLVNLETYVGQRSVLYQNNKKDLAQIREMLKYVASALKIIGGGGPALVNQLNGLTLLSPSATPVEIQARTDKVFGTMQLVFSSLKQPPALPVIDAATAPTTKPAGS
jgi:hypothetical protein